MLGWMRETKRVYDGTLYNVFIGTTVSPTASQNVEIDLRGARANASTEAEADVLEAKAMAKGIADLLVQMGNYNRKFNDYGFLRSYNKGEIKVIWNSEFINKIRKVDLPTIYHMDGLVDKFGGDELAPEYFGTKNAAKVVAGSNDGSYRAAVEKDYTLADTSVVHVFPGEAIPAAVEIAAGEGYVVDPDVICKVLVKLPPYMSAFEVGTSFFNPKSLTENHYLTFGHNTIEYLENYPFITVKSKASN